MRFSDNRKVDRAIQGNILAGLQMRGPDAEGSWQGDESEPTLLHRRLSILDLSDAGAQPMASANGRFVLSYNGEIYNHLDLRKELQDAGQTFEGTSDTETLLSAIETWGLKDTLPKLNGMFALAIWDRTTRELTLARDRLGIKPLFLWTHPDFIWFGSTLHAIPPSLRGLLSLNKQSVSGYFDCGYVPSSQSIFDNVRRVEPAMVTTIQIPETGPIAIKDDLWWKLDQSGERFGGSEEEATDVLGKLLEDSVQRRMLSDVPLGAFLSGGIDSSLVTSMMLNASGPPVKTFTIGVEHPRYDESEPAQAIADHLGTDHHCLKLDQKSLVDLVPHVLGIYDEPFADTSQFATYAVSKLAREHVTVCLSGDGGDELFMGYRRYQYAPKFWKIGSRLPRFTAPLVASLPVKPGVKRQLRAAIGSRSLEEYFRSLSCDTADASLLRSEFMNTNWTFDRESQIDCSNAQDKLSGIDVLHWLPNDILVKLDRASMAVGLEARVPILDHRVVEFSRSLPNDMKFRDGVTKRVLKTVLNKRVPESLLDRRKQGFGVPIDEWLSGMLADWAIELSQWEHPLLPWIPGQLEHQVRLAIKRNHWSPLTWRAIAFQAWFQQFMGVSSSSKLCTP